MEYAEKWDLDCFYSYEGHSKDLANEINQAREAIKSLESLKHSKDVVFLIQKMQEVDLLLRQLDAFILCLESQNIEDGRANQLRSELSSIQAIFEVFSNEFDHQLNRIDPTILSDSRLSEIRFVLEERKQLATQKLSLEQENLITELSVDGYHGWGELYPSLVAEIKIPFETKGETQFLSFGQAENKLSHPDRNVRQSVFSAQENCWKKNEKIFSQVLNHLAGFRLQVYSQRGWEDPLKEPLFENRMSVKTLNAMWDVVDEQKNSLLFFLQAKANLLGLEKLAWYDVEAPIFEKKESSISYSQSAELIIDQFSKFHPRMGAFAKRAFEGKWIEAEDRPGKRPGGFCVAFPMAKQSRIFMTYSGTMVNLSTLAHELGHAYHNAMVEDLPSFAQHYRMNVAETASTFAEQIISDSLLQLCKTKEDKLRVLSDRIQRSVIFFMNIRARFLFETQMYKKRKLKFLSCDELCSLMQNSQESAYGNALCVWNPYFWASKLHFYFTGVPFYNFPYTFGYLFSLGLYARAKKNGTGFADQYDALLKETGMMPVEELAKKHLGVDLTRQDFWKEAAEVAMNDVQQFLECL